MQSAFGPVHHDSRLNEFHCRCCCRTELQPKHEATPESPSINVGLVRAPEPKHIDVLGRYILANPGTVAQAGGFVLKLRPSFRRMLPCVQHKWHVLCGQAPTSTAAGSGYKTCHNLGTARIGTLLATLTLCNSLPGRLMIDSRMISRAACTCREYAALPKHTEGQLPGWSPGEAHAWAPYDLQVRPL